MDTKHLSVPFKVRTLKEMAADVRYRKYLNYLKEDKIGFMLFEAISTPENLFKMETFTEVEIPAITAIAESCYDILSTEIGNPEETDTNKKLNYAKQFIGAVVCYQMEINGYTKTSTRKSIPYKKRPGGKKNDPICFVKGTLYKKRKSDFDL